jgi:peroxiredoxin
MKNLLSVFLFINCLFISHISRAELKPGETAPLFSLQAALAGETFHFSLEEALQKGPVVLYFYPKAFTRGCSIEARLFAEASDEFKALHATVLGVSNDEIKTLQEFSVKDCSNKVAVGADPEGKVIRAYDARMMPLGTTASRTSYVITPDQKILYVYKALKPDDHPKNALTAIRQWQQDSTNATSNNATTVAE